MRYGHNFTYTYYYYHYYNISSNNWVFCKVDGFGSAYMMDDANVPSLLSLPYLGFCSPYDPLYQNVHTFFSLNHWTNMVWLMHLNISCCCFFNLHGKTRRFVLSEDNPYYFASSSIGPLKGGKRFFLLIFFLELCVGLCQLIIIFIPFVGRDWWSSYWKRIHMAHVHNHAGESYYNNNNNNFLLLAPHYCFI